jgi:hypothetical protein
LRGNVFGIIVDIGVNCVVVILDVLGIDFRRLGARLL